MSEIFPFLQMLGTKAGWLPLWGIFGMVLIAFIKVWPQLKQQSIDERLSIKNGYIDRIKGLERDVKECRDQCDADTRQLNEHITALQEELYGLRKQHIQEQISFINAITQSVDAPQLKILLQALENGSRALDAARITPVDGPVQDKGQP